MNENRPPSTAHNALDQKIVADWEAVLKRLADLNGRSGGDTRRQAILERLGPLKHAP